MTVVPVGNPHETEARMHKAIALADVLEAVVEETRAGEGDDFSVSDVVSRLDDKTWRLAAKRAQVNPPSDKTKAVVIALLQDREAVRAEFSEDPLRGLPTP